MEAEDSLLDSDEPATEYNPHPVQPSPQLHTLLLLTTTHTKSSQFVFSSRR
jgi:hypothetical protein